MKIILVFVASWSFLTGVWIYQSHYLLAGAAGVVGTVYAAVLIKDFKDKESS